MVSATTTNCFVTTQAICTGLHGQWHAGETCDAAACPPPPARGACCVSAAVAGPVCVFVTSATCTTLNGHYTADGTACSPTACPRPCICDWDHSGTITSADLHAFLTDFLAGNADINGDGQTNLADLNEFLDCYNHPPASCNPPILAGWPGLPALAAVHAIGRRFGCSAEHQGRAVDRYGPRSDTHSLTRCS